MGVPLKFLNFAVMNGNSLNGGGGGRGCGGGLGGCSEKGKFGCSLQFGLRDPCGESEHPGKGAIRGNLVQNEAGVADRGLTSIADFRTSNNTGEN